MTGARIERKPGNATKQAAESIKALREAQGMTQAVLSFELAKIGYQLSPAGIVKIERGYRNITVEDLAALAKVFQSRFEVNP